MKKSHRFDDLSDRVCRHPGCEKRIKIRLVLSKNYKPADHCYEHQPKHTISGHSARGRS